MKGRTLISNPDKISSGLMDRVNNCPNYNYIQREKLVSNASKRSRTELHSVSDAEFITKYPEVEMQTGNLCLDDIREIDSEPSFYHVYQRSVNKEKIFHSWIDALVFISILHTTALKSKVEISALCLMDNHLHLLVKANAKALSSLVQDYTIPFAKSYNKEYGKTGPLFSKRFGRAEKYQVKFIRTCIAYIFNNPVEAHKCSKAEKYAWNLLAFGYSSNPFSETLSLPSARSCMRQAVRQIKALCSRGKSLSYPMLKHLFQLLNKREALQLRDLILRSYNPINYDLIISLYGSLKNAMIAINSNTGAEYDIQEDD